MQGKCIATESHALCVTKRLVVPKRAHSAPHTFKAHGFLTFKAHGFLKPTVVCSLGTRNKQDPRMLRVIKESIPLTFLYEVSLLPAA